MKAKAPGLAPAELSLESAPVKVSSGLATQLSGTDLPVYLKRGPTPTTPSYQVSRVAMPVSAVETTSKPGEGSAAATSKLARRVPVTEVTLKLSGWRERGYPLQVFVDSKEVYQGMTPKSLGYVTLPLAANEGGDVRIGLNGVADESNAIKLTEVANQSIADTGANQTPKGVLSIVETEFYQQP